MILAARNFPPANCFLLFVFLLLFPITRICLSAVANLQPHNSTAFSFLRICWKDDIHSSAPDFPQSAAEPPVPDLPILQKSPNPACFVFFLLQNILRSHA